MKFRRKLIFPLIFSLIFSVTASHGIGNSPHGGKPDAIPVVSSGITDTMVIPGGKSIGVTLSTDGVMIINLAPIICNDGHEKSPAKDAGLKIGDIIKAFDG